MIASDGPGYKGLLPSPLLCVRGQLWAAVQDPELHAGSDWSWPPRSPCSCSACSVPSPASLIPSPETAPVNQLNKRLCLSPVCFQGRRSEASCRKESLNRAGRIHKSLSTKTAENSQVEGPNVRRRGGGARTGRCLPTGQFTRLECRVSGQQNLKAF